MEENKKDQELDGKKLTDTQTGEAVGGMFLNAIRYPDYQKPEFWAQYGITYTHVMWAKDTYTIYGVSVSADDAWKILEKAEILGRALTQEEIRALGIAGF